MVKITGCSPRGFGLHSQYPHGCPQLTVTLIPGDPILPHRHTHGQNTKANKINFLFFFVIVSPQKQALFPSTYLPVRSQILQILPRQVLAVTLQINRVRMVTWIMSDHTLMRTFDCKIIRTSFILLIFIFIYSYTYIYLTWSIWFFYSSRLFWLLKTVLGRVSYTCSPGPGKAGAKASGQGHSSQPEHHVTLLQTNKQNKTKRIDTVPQPWIPTLGRQTHVDLMWVLG